MTLDSRRFQFTIARLLACTTFMALAAWVIATPHFPGFPQDDFFWRFGKIFLLGGLLGSAVGALYKGKEGAERAFNLGVMCTLLIWIATGWVIVGYVVIKAFLFR